MLRIEIDAADANVNSRTFEAKEGKPARTIYWQVGYMYNGGRYPVRIEIPLDSGVPAYPAGMYELHSSNFQVSRFNKIEINPFSIKLMAIDEKKPLSKVS